MELIGPLGQGGFAIQHLGSLCLKLLPKTSAFGSFGDDPLHGGGIFYGLGVFLAFLMWGFGVLWLSFAIISIATMKHFPFNMGWWGFTFPLGVLTTCTRLLAQELSSMFFKVLTMVSAPSGSVISDARRRPNSDHHPDILHRRGPVMDCRGCQDPVPGTYWQDILYSMFEGFEGYRQPT